jgi:hypothetical protein
MKKQFIALFFALGVLLLAGNAQAQAIVIVNPGVKAADVSKADLRDVFTGGATNLKDGSSRAVRTTSFFPLISVRTTRHSAPVGGAWFFQDRQPCPSRSIPKRRS